MTVSGLGFHPQDKNSGHALTVRAKCHHWVATAYIASSPCPFVGGKGLVSNGPNLPGKHGKPEITVKLPYAGLVSSLCCVETVPTPPDSQRGRLLYVQKVLTPVYDPRVRW